MYLDNNLEFADALAVGTPNNTTVTLGEIIDLDIAREIGAGQPVFLVIQVTTALTSGGAAFIKAKIVSDSTTTIATDGTATEHGASDTIAVATWIIGFQLIIPLMPEDPAYERYLAFQLEETAGQALTAGHGNAFLTLNPRAYQAYADAVN